MVKVKGKYVGMVTITFSFDNDRPPDVPVESVWAEALIQLNAALKKLIADDVRDFGTVEVEPQSWDLHLDEGGKGDGLN